jgi:hypothetical protein
MKTYQQITKLAQQKMEELLNKYPTLDRTLLLSFWSEATEINSWISIETSKIR